VPKPKRSGATPTGGHRPEEDEETKRYNELRAILRETNKKAKRFKKRLQDLGVAEESAERIAFDYFVAKTKAFFEIELSPQSIDFPAYPKELEQVPPDKTPINPVNPTKHGYEIKVINGEGADPEAAELFVGYMLGVLRQIHPIPKEDLTIIVSNPHRYSRVKDFGQFMEIYRDKPSNVVGNYFRMKGSSKGYMALAGFKSFIHEFGHYIDDCCNWYAHSEKFNMLFGLPSPHLETFAPAYEQLKRTLRLWFNENKGKLKERLRELGWWNSWRGWLIDMLAEDDYELFAYTYEQYVIWKLMELGRSDLARAWLAVKVWVDGLFFPADMFKPIKDAYDEFFRFMRKSLRDKDVLK
jgi:hypothetical protein